MASSATTTTHSPPFAHTYSKSNNNAPHLPDFKRQRTHESENKRRSSSTGHDYGHVAEEERMDEEERTAEEEEILVEAGENAFHLKDTSLTEGSRQLTEEVESKLSLHEKVIGRELASPSGLMQGRLSRAFGKRTNAGTSLEEEGMAGLAALSTAAFLRLDEKDR
jgi:hypothetical protein